MDLHGVEAAMYLRKSRNEDGLPTEEILRRHKEALTEYANANKIKIAETFQEIKVSIWLKTEQERRGALWAKRDAVKYSTRKRKFLNCSQRWNTTKRRSKG